MKTINFELSQRLSELWLLDDIETQYCYFEWKYIAWDNKEYISDKLQLTPYFNWIKKYISNEYKLDYDDYNIIIVKTLTLEERLEFLPQYINEYMLEIYKCWSWSWNVCYINNYPNDNIITDRLCMYNWTIISAVEQLLKYLLDNKLIWNT